MNKFVRLGLAAVLAVSMFASPALAAPAAKEKIAVENSAAFLADPYYYWGEKWTSIFSYSADALAQIPAKDVRMFSVGYCFAIDQPDPLAQEGFRSALGLSWFDMFNNRVDSKKKNTLLKVVRVPVIGKPYDCATVWFAYTSEEMPPA